VTTAPSDAVGATAGEPAQFPLVLGLDTFGDVTHDEDDRPLSHAQTIRNVVEQGVLADQVGVDFFGIGEHHTDDFPLSAADVVLGAIAARTTRIHLGSAVTVLSSDDPIRVFQRYSTLNAISGGRAEVILGRGSSIDSFPLFGYDLADYADRSPGKARPAHRCATRMSCHTPNPDRSRHGSASAAAPSRSSAPHTMDSR
jgi:alkanesulfonate monooxygenase SsuD/methylene tetrahydromethanopterin reductase-like flavin-dependent oxidoreductase (luciferase family)